MTRPATNSIGAVVVSYNSAGTLTACITSLRQAGVDSIVVVDNASSDNSCAVARGLGVQLFEQLNLGFAAACNAGAQQVAGDFVLFLNPDAQLEPNAAAIARDYLAAHPAVGIVGLGLKNAAGLAEPHSFGTRVTLTALWLRKVRPAAPATEPTMCDWVSGGALLARRRAFFEVNGFDAGYFLYWEDVDLCARLQARGWKIVHVPAAAVRHVRGASLGDTTKKTALYDASADRYFRTHYATWIWLLQRLLRTLYRLFSPQVH